MIVEWAAVLGLGALRLARPRRLRRRGGRRSGRPAVSARCRLELRRRARTGGPVGSSRATSWSCTAARTRRAASGGSAIFTAPPSGPSSSGPPRPARSPILTRPRDGDGSTPRTTWRSRTHPTWSSGASSSRAAAPASGSWADRATSRWRTTRSTRPDNNAIAMNSGDTGWIRHPRGTTSTTPGSCSGAVGGTEGEGLYVGCHDGALRGSNHLIENNHIHDLRGTSDGGNDGIEIKRGLVRERRPEQRDPPHEHRHPVSVHLRVRRGTAANVVEGNAVW